MRNIIAIYALFSLCVFCKRSPKEPGIKDLSIVTTEQKIKDTLDCLDIQANDLFYWVRSVTYRKINFNNLCKDLDNKSEFWAARDNELKDFFKSKPITIIKEDIHFDS
jgi:hypothetical protein